MTIGDNGLKSNQIKLTIPGNLLQWFEGKLQSLHVYNFFSQLLSQFFLTIVVTIFAEDQIDNRMQRFEGAPQQLHVRFSHWKVDPPEHSVNIKVVSHLKMLSIFSKNLCFPVPQ